MNADRSDGLSLQNLIFFIRWMDHKHGIKAVTNPKEAIDAAQRAALCSRDRNHPNAGVRGNEGTLRTELNAGVYAGNAPTLRRSTGTLAPGSPEEQTPLRVREA